MNDKKISYTFQIQMTKQELAQWREAYEDLQNEVVEIFVEAEQHTGFQTANQVINRIRSM